MDYSVRSEVQPVDCNPEMADVDNPHGWVEGLVHYVVAEREDGRRLAHFAIAVTCNGHQLAGDYPLERLQALRDKLQEEQPVLDMRYWKEIDPCYGSEYYQLHGPEPVFDREDI